MGKKKPKKGDEKKPDEGAQQQQAATTSASATSASAVQPQSSKPQQTQQTKQAPDRQTGAVPKQAPAQQSGSWGQTGGQQQKHAQNPQSRGQQPQAGAWGQAGGQHQGGGQQKHAQKQQSGGQQPQAGAWGQAGGQQQQGGGQQKHAQMQQSGGQQRQGGARGQAGGQQQQGGGQQKQAQKQQFGGQQPQSGQWRQETSQPQQQSSQSQQFGGKQQKYDQRQVGGQQQQQQQYAQQPGGQPGQRQQGGRSLQPLGSNVSSSGIARGTIGIPGQVATNYLEMNLSKMPDVAYHYDITITPDRPKKFMQKVFDEFSSSTFKGILMAYDLKKSFYTAEKLPVPRAEKDIEILDSNGRKISYKVEIKETENMIVELKSLTSYHKDRVFDKPMRALQCLEVVLSSACHNRGVRVGRSFFIPPSRNTDLGDGFEMWLGIYQAIILGDRPFLNVDISHKSFPKGLNLIEYIKTSLYNANVEQGLNQYQLNDLRSFLKGINVIYEPPQSFARLPRSYRVNDISDKPASSLSFTTDDGTKLTVASYFRSQKYELRFPNLPCLQVGSTARVVYLPMELCKIETGQALNRKDGAKQVQNMIRFAATSTDERKAKIMEMLQHFQHNANPTIQRFGLNINNNFVIVPTRILPSPVIEYLNGQTVNPYKGAWNMSDRMSFYNTKKITNGHKWAIIYFRNGGKPQDVGKLEDLVCRQANQLKMSLEPRAFVREVNQVESALADLRKNQYELVFVVVPNRGPSYAKIKQIAELQEGILTQCIKQQTLERRVNPMLVLNLLLKVNAKLNGTNHIINVNTSVPLDNVMYLGADVTHPSPDQRHIPSVVGVAASHDRFGACYNMQYRLQKSTLEDIEDMETIVQEHLRIYFSYQKRYPDYIIYYRDGVSDGQFPKVKQNELRGIRSACRKFNCSAKLTCVIVVKRHHTRFFPQGNRPLDKFNNVAPGTVVDRIIVHPNEVQFFMVSHQSIQGTAKPTRYNVIEDDAKLNIDLLQKLTYNLCHMFPRCNRVVSYPAPAYLAHLVAYRGRVYIEGTSRFFNLNDEYKKRLVNSNFLKSNPMYFV